MTANYDISCVDSVIEVRVTGTPDRPSIAQMWKDIVVACKDHHCLSILGLSDMDQPLKLADAIDHQAIFLEAGSSVFAPVSVPPRMRLTSTALLSAAVFTLAYSGRYYG